MVNEAFVHEVFRAHLALYRHHLRHHDNEEMLDDLRRAEKMCGVLALRYPLAHCQTHYEWFLEGVNAA